MSEIPQGIWTPQDYEQFSPEDKDLEIKEDLNPERVQELIGGWGRLLEGKKLNPFDYQTRLSRLFLRTLEYYGDQEESVARKELGRIYNFYRTMFRNATWYSPDLDWDFEKFRSGFAAEYAVARSLTQGDHQVYYPTEKDDQVLKVDWWVYPKQEDSIDGPYWGVQVKSIGFRTPGLKEPMIFDAKGSDRESQKELGEIAASYFPQEQQLKFIRTNNQLRVKLRRYHNVIPRHIFVPSALFDYSTGKPSEQLVEQLNQKIEKMYFPEEKNEERFKS